MRLLLKLVLVPALVMAVTLAARRWGLRVAGVVTGLPLVAGPTFAFLAIEQGHDFAASAARAAILGIIATAAFSVAYGRIAARANWAASLVAGWVAFAAVGTSITRVPDLGGIGELAMASVVLLAARRLLRPPAIVAPAGTPPRADLVLRMVSAAGAVVLFTALADLVGPRVSGVLSVFPLVTAILAVFTHRQRGHGAAAVYLRGLLGSLDSLAVFCLVFSLALTVLGWPLLPAMAVALAAQVAMQAVVLWRL
jgi:hypothetical protein